MKILLNFMMRGGKKIVIGIDNNADEGFLTVKINDSITKIPIATKDEMNNWKQGLYESIDTWKKNFDDSVKFEDAQDGKTTLAYDSKYMIVGKWNKESNKGEVITKPTEKYDMYF